MNLENYIKDLDPGLQERARACGSLEELLALAKEERVPVPDEVLEAIAGGADVEAGSCNAKKCPKCGHKEDPYQIEHLSNGLDRFYFKCSKCGCKWCFDFPRL